MWDESDTTNTEEHLDREEWLKPIVRSVNLELLKSL